MAKCSFCGEAMERGTGKMDVKILYFCSTKCEKNTLKLGRKFLETRWSSKYKKERQEKREE